MKIFRSLLMASLLVLGIGAGSAMAQDIIVINATGFTIQALGLSHSSEPNATEDLLGQNVLPSTDNMTISISGATSGWELIAQDESGNQVNWPNLNLSGVSRIVLFANGTVELQ